MHKLTKINLLILIMFLAGCGEGKKIQDTANTAAPAKAKQPENLLLLDSLAASTAIITDELDHFYTKVTNVEMAIQLKDNSLLEDREKLMTVFKADLQKDVRNFTDKEKNYLNSVFAEAFKYVNQHSRGFKYEPVKLIKISGKHYGGFTFYTRENCIVIPEPTFNMPREGFIQTMFHELFHIYSRYNEAQRHKLYELISFKPMGNSSNLVMKENLREKVLHNPDGVNFAYAIELTKDNGEKYMALPIITANDNKFDPAKKAFFDYLDFNLFPLNAEHTLRVVSDDRGNSTLDLQKIPEFFLKIGDNTNYIIHPDEILADNYAFIMMGKRDPAFLNRFSVDGKALMKKIERIIGME